jgi:hypothetical protein
MRYYLAVIQNNTTSALFGYDTYDEALSAFHTEMAYRGEGRDSTLCIIFNSSGELLYTERWNRP